MVEGCEVRADWMVTEGGFVTATRRTSIHYVRIVLKRKINGYHSTVYIINTSHHITNS